MENNTIKYIKTLIVGSGPAGLQLGYFLDKIKEEYIILEKSNISGSFFNKFPHSKELISINKVYTGEKDKEFNLRHDWNSLLNNHKLEMKKYTKDYYPSRDHLVKYLNDFSKLHKIKVQYNTCVSNISKKYNDKYKKELFQIKCLHNDSPEIWFCDKGRFIMSLSFTDNNRNFMPSFNSTVNSSSCPIRFNIWFSIWSCVLYAGCLLITSSTTANAKFMFMFTVLDVY